MDKRKNWHTGKHLFSTEIVPCYLSTESSHFTFYHLFDSPALICAMLKSDGQNKSLVTTDQRLSRTNLILTNCLQGWTIIQKHARKPLKHERNTYRHKPETNHPSPTFFSMRWYASLICFMRSSASALVFTSG